jgi:hypothetical protein
MESTLGRIALAVVLALISAVAAFAWLYHYRGGGFLNPKEGLEMIERLATANRDLEMIEWLPRAELIRTKHRSSGREILFTYSDVNGQRTAVGFEDHPVDHQAGWRAPVWVPVYPGAQVVASKSGGPQGELLLAVGAPFAKVVDHYRSAIRAEGMMVLVERLSGDEMIVRGAARDGSARLSAKLIGRKSGTQVRIEYESLPERPATP